MPWLPKRRVSTHPTTSSNAAQGRPAEVPAPSASAHSDDSIHNSNRWYKRILTFMQELTQSTVTQSRPTTARASDNSWVRIINTVPNNNHPAMLRQIDLTKDQSLDAYEPFIEESFIADDRSVVVGESAVAEESWVKIDKIDGRVDDITAAHLRLEALLYELEVAKKTIRAQETTIENLLAEVHSNPLDDADDRANHKSRVFRY